jgi:hypothetical protein
MKRDPITQQQIDAAKVMPGSADADSGPYEDTPTVKEAEVKPTYQPKPRGKQP